MNIHNIRRTVFLLSLLASTVEVYSQSWNLVWREDFGVAEDTVIKDFPNNSMTVPRHSFAAYESKAHYGSDGNIDYHEQGELQGDCGYIDDGQYGIANSTWWAYNRFAECKLSAGHFVGGRDHTNNKNGAMLIVNSEIGTGLPIYSQKIEFDLCDSRKYRFVVYAASITAYQDDGGNANLELKVINAKTGDEIKNIKTDDIPFWEFGGWGTPNPSDCATCNRNWTEYSCEFTANDGDVLELQVTNWGSGFNDFVLDDISLFRYDENEVPVPEISATSAAAASGNDCSYLAYFSVPKSVITEWEKLYDKAYFLWQQSTDDGITWTNVLNVSGINKTDVEIELDKTKNTIFRLITTGGSTEALAKEQALYIAANGGPKDGCAYYSISNTLSAKPENDCTYSDDLKALFVEDFGTVADNGVTSSSNVKMEYKEKGLTAGNYAITANPQNTMQNSWDGIPEFTDHTGNADGGMIFCKLNKDVTTIYERTVAGPFCKCKSYIVSLYATALGGWSTLKMEAVVEDDKGNILASLPIEKGNNGNEAAWQHYLLDFSPSESANSMVVKLVNTDTGTESYGTNVVIDDIALRICGIHIPQDSIYIDKDVDLKSLTNFDCTEEPGHTIDLSSMDGWAKDYPNASVVWQSSTDGGETWNTLSATGKSIKFESEDGGDISYRAIIGEDAATAKAVANGNASDGCGIYLITNTVNLSCTAQCHFNDEMLVLWKDDFGSVPAGTRKQCAYLKGHKYNKSMKESVNDGEYAVVSRMKDAGTWFASMDGTDHTGNADGGFLVLNVDPDYKGKVIYEQTLGFTTCNETSYYFSLWAASISKRVANGETDGVLCNLTLEITDATSGDILASIETGDIPNAASLSGNIPWKNYGISFVSKGEKVKLRIYDHAGNGKKGNDLALDDISLIACEQAAPKVELAVEGEDDVTGICNETTYTLTMGDIEGWNKIYGEDVYCLWQKSADGGETWETLTTKSGLAKTYGQLEVTALRNMQEVNDSLVNVGYRYRVIVAGPKSEVTEQIAKQGYPNDGCYLYRVSNVMTVRCECNAPEFEAKSDEKFNICEDGEEITLKVAQTNTIALDSVCWYSKAPKETSWTLVKKYEGEKVVETSLERILIPTDSISYLFLGYNEECASDSIIFSINVDKPIVLKELASTILCVGSDTTYKAELAEGCTGKPLSYEWNGTASTDDEYTIENISQDATVKLVAKGAICVSEPVTATIEAEKETEIGSALTDTEVCALDKTTFNSEAVAANIQWYQSYSGKDIFTKIEGGTTAELTCSPDSSRTYKVVASGVKCPSKELSVNVKVNYPAKIEASIDKTEYCLGGTSTITVTLDHVTSLRWMAKAESETEFTPVKTKNYSDSDTETSETFTPEITTKYIVQTPSEGCAAAQSDEMTVTVEQPIDFTLAADKELICRGSEAVTLKANLIAGNVDDVEGNAKEALTNGTLSVTPENSTTYSVKATGKLCTTSVEKSVDVEVEIPTTFSELTTPKATVCEKTAVELNCTVTPSDAPYSIMKSDDGARFTEIEEAGAPTETTYYKYQSKAGKACKPTETNIVKVEVEDSVRYTFTAKKETICVGDEVELTYKKKSGNITSSVIKGDQDITITTANTYYAAPTATQTYEAVVSGKVCPEVKKAIAIEVQQPATLSIEVDKTSICVNDKVNITLTAQNAQSTQWFSSTNGEKFSEISTDGTNLQPQQKTWYKVGAIGSEACSNSMSNTVTVDVEDSIRFTLKQPAELICSGTAITGEIKLETGAPKSIAWTKNGEDQASALTMRDTPTDPSNHYVATVTGTECPAVNKTFDVNVEEQAIINSFDASSSLICIHSDVELTVDQEKALGLIWEKKTNDGDFETLSEELTTSLTDQPTEKTYYRVRTTGAEICRNATSPIITVLVEDSVAVSLPTDTFICPGASLSLGSKVKGNPKSIEWVKITSAGEEVMNTSSKNLSLKPTETTTYRLTAKAEQCPESKAEMVVNVEEIPELTVTASADSLCVGEEVTLSASFTNDTSIVWMNRFANGIVYADIAKGEASITEAPTASMEYAATAVTEHGCKVKSEVLSVAVSAKIIAIADNISICEGDTSELKVLGEGAYQYEWFADAAHSELLSTSNKLEVQPTENATYYLVVTNGSCKEELTPEVEVASLPRITNLADRAAREIEVIATGGNGTLEYQYGVGKEWTTDNLFTNFYFGKPYTISVRDELGCTSDTSFTTSTYDIKVPSVVTPNGDGVNDAFEIVNFSKYPNSVIRIYDRFGKLLIKQTTDDYEAWDGTYNGNRMPSTDYWYDIWIEELAQYFTGHFTLIWGDN